MTDPTSEVQPTTDNASTRFPSLDSMRAAHSNLLKRQREKAKARDLLADVEAFILKGRATGALLDEEDERWAAQGLLDYWSTRLYRPGYEPPDATLVDFDRNIAPELDDALCPYVGLEAFSEGNKEIFFGRTRLVNEMVNKLKTTRLLAVLGSSGSGKASLVRAGLIPALKGGALPDSANRHYFPPMAPGANPLANLSEVTRPPQARSEEWAGSEARDYLARPGHLPDLINGHYPSGVVLVVAQFEEVFTLCADDDIRLAFVNTLAALVSAEQVVIITMRTEFENQVARLPEFQKLFEQAVVRVGPLTASELREVIEAPAKKIGLKFEEGVVDALLNDILGEPAALPLLQFTLLKLWERRDRNRVTWEAYRKVGGGRQALANAADELYDSLTPEEQVTCRRILLKMVKPGEGLEVISGRVRRDALYHKAEDNDRIDRVLDKLVRARLVRVTQGATKGDASLGDGSPSEAQFEVAHEALVRNWPRLVDWLDEERVTLRQRLRLTAAAENWLRLGKDQSALRRGALLDEALKYDDLNPLEAEFVKASQAAQEAAEREQEAIRQRELNDARRIAETEKQRAEEQARAAKRLRLGNRIITAVGVLAFLMALVAIYFALQANQAASRSEALAAANVVSAQTAQAASTQAIAQKNAADAASTEAVAQQSIAEAASTQAVAQESTAEAERDRANEQSRLALARELALQGFNVSLYQHDLGLLLGLEATRLSDGDDVRGALADIVRDNPRLKQYFYGHAAPVTAVALSPDGKVLASGDAVNVILLWDVATAKPVSQIAGHTGGITGLDFSADGKMLASSSLDGTARLWEIVSGKELDRPAFGSDDFEFTEVRGVGFRPDGRTIRITSCARPPGSNGACNRLYVWIWDFVNTRRTGGLLFTGVILPDLTFTRDEKLLASSDRKVVNLRSVAGGSLAALEHEGNVTGIAFSLDGRLVASGSSDQSAIVWDVNRRVSLVSPFYGHVGTVRSLALSADDKTLVTGGDDTAVILWEVVEAQPAVQPTAEVTITPQELVALKARACQIAGRNLTQAEWAEFFPATEPYRKTCEQWPAGQ
jgi:hypothetical protein